MKKIYKEVKETIRKKGKLPLFVFLTLRTLVILCMILQLIRGDMNNALLCLLSLILFLLPSIIEKKLNIDLPNGLEIIIYLFIFSAEILGEINNFYGIIPFWDDLLHTLNGFLCAAIGFSLIDLLNNKSDKINLSPLYLCIVSFCFSMTIGVFWEFFEYGADKIVSVDMQKDTLVTEISTVFIDPLQDNNAVVIDKINKTIIYDENGNVLTQINGGYLDIGINDTMKDLFVNFIGAFVFCILGYSYLVQRKSGFIYHFVPKKTKRSE